MQGRFTKRNGLLSHEILFVLLIMRLLLPCSPPQTTEQITKQKNIHTNDTATKQPVNTNSIKERLEKFTDFNEKEKYDVGNITSLMGFTIALAVNKSRINVLHESEKSNYKKIQESAVKLKAKIITWQKLNFPLLRATFAKKAADLWWEDNITVVAFGKGNTGLKFTGYYFASNRNIGTIQERISEIAKLLRFKEVQYLWYKSQKDYTFYNLHTERDDYIE